MKYVVTQEIKSRTKVAKGIYVQDFFFLVIFTALSLLFSNAVNSSLYVPYAIFSVIIALWLIGSSYQNRQRRNFQSALIFLRKDRSVYRPVKNISAKPKEPKRGN